MAIAKILFLSFPIALWYLISTGWGWGSVLMIVPVTVFIGLAFTVILEWFIEPLVRWINK
jgi:hypothetical protein